MEIGATDYHTAGEPFRIVARGRARRSRARRSRERREHAAGSEEVDRVRRLLCHEPRGHADMYGCFLVPPDDDGADLGVLFWHKDGYSTACGHGTIALGAWAVESGRVAAPDDGEVDVTIDVPSGRVVARVRRRGGAVERVAFRNVPSFVVARDVAGGRRRRSTSPTAARSTPSRRRSASGCGSCPSDLPRADRGRPRGQAGARGERGRAPSRATSGSRASTGRSSTRSSARSTSATWRSSPTARSIARRRGSAHVGAHARCSPPTARSARGRRWRNDSIVGTTLPRPRHRRGAGRACSPRSRARRSAPASTASCSTRATRSAPASSCAEKSALRAHPARRTGRRTGRGRPG